MYAELFHFGVIHNIHVIGIFFLRFLITCFIRFWLPHPEEVSNWRLSCACHEVTHHFQQRHKMNILEQTITFGWQREEDEQSLDNNETRPGGCWDIEDASTTATQSHFGRTTDLNKIPVTQYTNVSHTHKICHNEWRCPNSFRYASNQQGLTCPFQGRYLTLKWKAGSILVKYTRPTKKAKLQ